MRRRHPGRHRPARRVAQAQCLSQHLIWVDRRAFPPSLLVPELEDREMEVRRGAESGVAQAAEHLSGRHLVADLRAAGALRDEEEPLRRLLEREARRADCNAFPGGAGAP